MILNSPTLTTEQLLAKATQPARDALRLHPFYRGKIETAVKCRVRDVDDFAIWYTPGVAAACKALAAAPELAYEIRIVEYGSGRVRWDPRAGPGRHWPICRPARDGG